MCHGGIALRNTVFADGRAAAFIAWDGIFTSTPMWDLAHAVWQFATVCDDADRWLGGWPRLSNPKDDPRLSRKPCVSSRKPTVRCVGSLVRVRSEEHPLGGA